MIIVRNRELIIPRNEAFIGTEYDTDSENRYFKIDRMLPSQIDLAGFTFVLDVIYADGTSDSLATVKEIFDDYIVLRVDVSAMPSGNNRIQLRASDTSGRRWSSAEAVLYAMDSISNPSAVTPSTTLTELEQLETRIENSEEIRQTEYAELKSGFTEAVETCRASAESASASETVATAAADSAASSAYAAAGYAESAEAIVGIDIATPERAGIVKPDGNTISVDEFGKIIARIPQRSWLDNSLMTLAYPLQGEEYGGNSYPLYRWRLATAYSRLKPTDILGIWTLRATSGGNGYLMQTLSEDAGNALQGKTVTAVISACKDAELAPSLKLVTKNIPESFNVIETLSLTQSMKAFKVTFTVPDMTTGIGLRVDKGCGAVIGGMGLYYGTDDIPLLYNENEELLRCFDNAVAPEEPNAAKKSMKNLLYTMNGDVAYIDGSVAADFFTRSGISLSKSFLPKPDVSEALSIDDFVEPGFFRYTTTHRPTGAPAAAGYILVFGTDNFKLQVNVQYLGTAIYYRTYYNGSWNGWKQFTVTDYTP